MPAATEGSAASKPELIETGSSPTSKEPPPTAAEELLARLTREEAGDGRTFKRTVIVAVVAHVALLLLSFPEFRREPDFVAKPGRVYVMQQMRFKAPDAKPKAAQKQIPKKKAKRIPIPDPTPDEPEPIVVDDIVIPELEETVLEEAFFGIPEGDDSGAAGAADGAFEGAVEAGDGTTRPEKIFYPQPRYTEEARLKRIQGVAILLAVIDEKGNVRGLQVVKGLPLGLTESAVKTVETWRFKPAVRLDTGEPIRVKMYLTINFRLQ